MYNFNSFFSDTISSGDFHKITNKKNVSSIQKLLTKRYVQDKNIGFITNKITSIDEDYIENEVPNEEDDILKKNFHCENEIEKRPNWWRGSENEDILDPCFKKPIYSGKSNFNFLPKFLCDNMVWFKRRRLKVDQELDFNCDLDKKSIIEYRKQQRMTESQENSKYKYISPYSEYLLERMKWKIALRIYYTLDPDKKGHIELQDVKNKLIRMLRSDTEKAQTLLLLIETITPFLVKNGYIEKNDIINYLAREISEETRGYGLFSNLKKIFKNPILRERLEFDDQKLLKGFDKNLIEKKNTFSLNPEELKIKVFNTKLKKTSSEFFITCSICNSKNNNIDCKFKKGHCITSKLKNRCVGNLQDHIKNTLEKKRKFIERVKEEQRIKEEKNNIECTFKPEILWPIGAYLKKSMEKNWSKDISKKTNIDKKDELIMGYKVISERNLNDPNIEISLSNLSSECAFNFNRNWNGYIHDSNNNQIYILHKGHVYEENIKNNMFISQTKIEEPNKKLYAVAREVEDEFYELETKENQDQKEKEKRILFKEKLIDILRSERKKGTNDPRFNNPEYTIDFNIPEFKEKFVDLNKLTPYKEVANHEKKKVQTEYISKPSCYYLPKGYEIIQNDFNEYHFRKKLYFGKNEINECINKSDYYNEINNEDKLFECNLKVNALKDKSKYQKAFQIKKDGISEINDKNQVNLNLKSISKEISVKKNTINKKSIVYNQKNYLDSNTNLNTNVENKHCLSKDSQNSFSNVENNLNENLNCSEYDSKSKTSNLLKSDLKNANLKKNNMFLKAKHKELEKEQTSKNLQHNCTNLMNKKCLNTSKEVNKKVFLNKVQNKTVLKSKLNSLNTFKTSQIIENKISSVNNKSLGKKSATNLFSKTKESSLKKNNFDFEKNTKNDSFVFSVSNKCITKKNEKLIFKEQNNIKIEDNLNEFEFKVGVGNFLSKKNTGNISELSKNLLKNSEFYVENMDELVREEKNEIKKGTEFYNEKNDRMEFFTDLRNEQKHLNMNALSNLSLKISSKSLKEQSANLLPNIKSQIILKKNYFKRSE